MLDLQLNNQNQNTNKEYSKYNKQGTSINYNNKNLLTLIITFAHAQERWFSVQTSFLKRELEAETWVFLTFDTSCFLFLKKKNSSIDINSSYILAIT